MNEAAIAQTVLTVFLLSVFLGFFIWGWRSGQFKNIEDAKYHVFQDNAKKEMPGRVPGQRSGGKSDSSDERGVE